MDYNKYLKTKKNEIKNIEGAMECVWFFDQIFT